jgi:hypothetical protein
LYIVAECQATNSRKKRRDRGLTGALTSAAKHNDLGLQIIEYICDGKTARVYGNVQHVEEKRSDVALRSKDINSDRKLNKWETILNVRLYVILPLAFECTGKT